ncbi:PREDICTED: dual specificity protein phosphatase CDC14A-like [Dufourea novaeangliae]|uniref:dual specificity protein phosphatase CDC14A-like n=1 Tax=Dufourea novaeangliae TaxID=178035 RepID=UPI0007679509|nr:PREDICTED: dual specificity protein phosphatase CDC14A-like [Dufourea novaeangliae]
MYEPKSAGLSRNYRNICNNRPSDAGEINTVYKHPDIIHVCEFIKDRFYFATLANVRKDARTTSNILFFTIDDELIYNNFYNDFGPLNIGCLYRYCCKVNKKLQSPANKNKRIVHYTSQTEHKRANAAYLVASYAVLYLNKSPEEAYNALFMGGDVPLKPFQDASIGTSIYKLHILDCLNALQKAASFGFFNFNDFDLFEYEKYEDLRNGDLNWIVPQKFLAFVDPSTELGIHYNPPECYIDYFLRNGVIAVVRLNKKTYDSSSFSEADIAHYDMFMPDGTVPPKRILHQFLALSENTTGPIAVHCKAGLGRTGSLIAAYLIKHYKMTAREAIAWIRICRPGSVIGHQQTWLENMEKSLLNAGEQYRLKHYGDGDVILYHKQGIYSVADKMERSIHGSPRDRSTESNQHNSSPTEKSNKTKFTRILGKLRNIRGTDDSEKGSHNQNPRTMTQGDRLNEIKMNKHKLSRSSDSNQKNYLSYGLESLRNVRKRK